MKNKEQMRTPKQDLMPGAQTKPKTPPTQGRVSLRNTHPILPNDKQTQPELFDKTPPTQSGVPSPNTHPILPNDKQTQPELFDNTPPTQGGVPSPNTHPELSTSISNGRAEGQDPFQGNRKAMGRLKPARRAGGSAFQAEPRLARPRRGGLPMGLSISLERGRLPSNDQGQEQEQGQGQGQGQGQEQEQHQGQDIGLMDKVQVQEPSFYKVILLNDDFTPMEFVTHVLQKFFNKTPEEAKKVMMDVHSSGFGVAGVFSFEVAETKVFLTNNLAKQNQYPLKCKMEKD